MPRLRRDDVTLYYAERGDRAGPPVVLLHGLTLSSRSMERLAASLPDHRVVLVDLRGHGRSTALRRTDRYRTADFVDDVVALLDHLEIDHAVLGGLSLGANVVYEIALRHPERVRALILEMPVFARALPAGRYLFSGLALFFAGLHPVLTPWHPLIRRIPLPHGAPELTYARELLTADHLAQAALVWSIAHEQPPAKDPTTLSPITMPVLVTAHSYDPIHSAADAEELAADLADARRMDLRSILDFVLRHGEIANEVGAFLRELPTPAEESLEQNAQAAAGETDDREDNLDDARAIGS